jgi:hypothetical protein
MTTFPAAKPLARALVLMGLGLTIAACKGLTAIDPSFPNVTASDTVFALNSGPPNAPNSINFFQGLTDRADQGFGFDIAFDIDQNGNAVIIPSRALATSFSNPYSVGLQRATTVFDLVLSAPKDGYRVDTAMTVAVDQAIIIESHDFNACFTALKGQSYFSKLVVTGVDPVTRRIAFTTTVNRNCGFHSFAPGLPRD